jgi:serine protease Do
VTNNHVVENADSLSVQFIDQQNAEAAIKGTDPSNDLAVIAVSLDGLSKDTLDTIRVATLGDSDKLQIGEPAIAIGNALGYGQSVTVGYISAINREIRDENGASGTFIQTDAAINPGNSGGALVNINGEVIGINSSKIGGAAVEGMGFAIPTTKALPIIEELMNQTTRTKVADDKQGTLGISGVSVTENISSAYDIPVGVYVAEILENGGAAASDLQKGDIITAIDGTSVGDMEGLKKQLTYYEAGTEVTVTVQRQARNGGYETKDIKITLGNRDSLNSGSKESGGTGSLFQPGQGDSDDSSIGG